MPAARATNLEIQKWVVRHHGFMPETGWIEHCKEDAGVVPPGTFVAPFTNPCPPEKKVAIIQAFRHFGILQQATELRHRQSPRQECTDA